MTIQAQFSEKIAALHAQGERNGRIRTEYEKMLVLMARLKKDLSQVQSFKRKAEMKKTALQDFKPWITGALKGNGQQDNVLTQWLVYALDIEKWELAEKIATYSVKHGLVLPPEFVRTLPTFYLETLASTARKKRELGQKFAIKHLKNALNICKDQDVNEMILAKVYREIGERQAKRGSRTAAATLKKALTLDINCGAKSTYGRVTRRQARLERQKEDLKALLNAQPKPKKNIKKECQ